MRAEAEASDVGSVADFSAALATVARRSASSTRAALTASLYCN
jgi:hypothetical protein